MSVNKVESDGSLQRVAGGTLYADMPVGTITPYGGSTAPSGFLLCNGQAVSRTTYADLFKAIGTSFGSGDGSKTFNVPDLRGKFAEGTPNGESVGTVKSEGLPNITGNLGYLKALDSGTYYQGYNNATGVFKSSQNQTASPAAAPAKSADGTTNASGLVVFKASDSNSIYGASTTVQPPAVCVNYIIKALQTAVPRDIQAYIEEAISPKDITSQVTFSASGFTFGKTKVTRTGDTVEVSLDVTVNNATESVVFVTGLPKPAFTLKVVAISSANATSIYAANLLDSGRIGTHWTWANGTYFLHFTYTTAD